MHGPINIRVTVDITSKYHWNLNAKSYLVRKHMQLKIKFKFNAISI